MIAIDVELLTGRFVASTFNDRAVAEWPPHPARLFSALVATAKENEELREKASLALEWLEQQGAPRILASHAEPRAVVTVYVPGNTTRVLSGWDGPEQKVVEARGALAEAEASGDRKELQRAQKAVEKAERALTERLTKATLDDGKHNDSNVGQGLSMLPDKRGKQPRTFPSVTPTDPRIRYVWPSATPDESTREALSDLGRRLVRLGHSSSLVACRVSSAEQSSGTSPGEQREWVPTADGGSMMRTVGAGQLRGLESAFERHQGVDPRVLPAIHQSYELAGKATVPKAAQSVFGEWLVFREVERDGARRVGLRLQRTEDIARAMRGALLHHAEDPPPEVLAGHAPDGKPSERPHIAFLALADVGSNKYSSGAILGTAILLPREMDAADRRAVLRAVGRWEEKGLELTLGRIGAMRLERITDRDPRKTLDPASWTRPSKRWASVTPVALDKNPGDLFSRDPKVVNEAVERAEEIVADACERIGLPRPKWVEVSRRSLFDAAPKAAEFMPFPRQGKSFRRVCVHAEMRFHEDVAGPVVIGAGRYLGVGVCRGRE